jgi:hypothetical protein
MLGLIPLAGLLFCQQDYCGEFSQENRLTLTAKDQSEALLPLSWTVAAEIYQPVASDVEQSEDKTGIQKTIVHAWDKSRLVDTMALYVSDGTTPGPGFKTEARPGMMIIEVSHNLLFAGNEFSKEQEADEYSWEVRSVQVPKPLPGTWHHVAASFRAPEKRGQVGEVSIFWDGEHQGTFECKGPWRGASDVEVGYDSHGWGRSWGMGEDRFLLDRVLIWERALLPDEIIGHRWGMESETLFVDSILNLNFDNPIENEIQGNPQLHSSNPPSRMLKPDSSAAEKTDLPHEAFASLIRFFWEEFDREKYWVLGEKGNFRRGQDGGFILPGGHGVEVDFLARSNSGAKKMEYLIGLIANKEDPLALIRKMEFVHQQLTKYLKVQYDGHIKAPEVSGVFFATAKPMKAALEGGWEARQRELRLARKSQKTEKEIPKLRVILFELAAKFSKR